MRSAAPSLLLLILLAATSPQTWSAEGSAGAKDPSIRVEAMVGEAVVVFEDIDCPEGEIVRVPTGEYAQTNPATCETVVALSNVVSVSKSTPASSELSAAIFVITWA